LKGIKNIATVPMSPAQKNSGAVTVSIITGRMVNCQPVSLIQISRRLMTEVLKTLSDRTGYRLKALGFRIFLFPIACSL